MNNFGKFAITVAFAAIAMAFAGCNQMKEANKLVDEANAIIKKSNGTSTKSAVLLKEMFGELNTIEDLGDFKASKKEKLEELLTLLEGSSKDLADAGSKFDSASKLSVSPKFKEYLELKAQEIRKRSDHEKATADFVRSFQAENDPEKVNSMSGEFGKKSESIIKEADELMKKAEQIVNDNRNEFKQ